MSTFNPTTGCVGNLCPPFNSDQDYANYITALKTAGVIQTIQESRINTNTTGDQLKITSNFYPAVQVVSFGKFEHFSKDTTLAIVYVNPAGRSMFAYKNDSGNLISLIDGGCQIAPELKNLVQTAAAPSSAPTWVITMFFIIAILGLIGIIYYMTRPVVPQKK